MTSDFSDSTHLICLPQITQKCQNDFAHENFKEVYHLKTDSECLRPPWCALFRILRALKEAVPLCNLGSLFSSLF